MIFNQIPSLYNLYALRWLDGVFQGRYLTSLSINYVAINKDLKKSPLQLYWINNGERTEWGPIRSVIIQVLDKIRPTHSGSPICLITSIITDRIVRTTLSPVTN